MITFIKRYWILAAILILGAFLRLHQLDKLPAGVFCDEANIGYSAFSLLTKGVDEHGIKFPLFFEGFGDYRLPIPIYLQLPIVSLLGLSTFSIRLTVALISILTIFIFYKIGEEAVDRDFGLVAAFILALSPWHIHMTRNAMEWSYPVIFISLAILFFLKARKKGGFLYLATIFTALAVYTYYSAVLTAPLFFLIVISYFLFKKALRKEAFISFFIFLVILLPFIHSAIQGKSTSRFKTIIGERQINNLGEVKKLAFTYLNHFDPNFLFFNSREYEFIRRHSIKDIGQLPRFGVILIPIGGLFLFLKNKRKNFLFEFMITTLLLLFPLPGLFNENGGPIATRAILGIIPLNLLLALGLYVVLSGLPKIKPVFFQELLIVIVFALVCIESLNFFDKYYNQYNAYANDFWGWQYGPSEIISYFKTEKYNYDELYMTGFFNAPQIFLNFYDPGHVCNNCFIGGIDKIDLHKKQLFAFRPEELKGRKDYIIKKVIYYPNGVAAFFIVKFNLSLS